MKSLVGTPRRAPTLPIAEYLGRRIIFYTMDRKEAAKKIANQQLLINVVSKRVRQLGLGHRPMVETTPRMSLTDIALKEIIEDKLSYEPLSGSADSA